MQQAYYRLDSGGEAGWKSSEGAIRIHSGQGKVRSLTTTNKDRQRTTTKLDANTTVAWNNTGKCGRNGITQVETENTVDRGCGERRKLWRREAVLQATVCTLTNKRNKGE